MSIGGRDAPCAFLRQLKASVALAVILNISAPWAALAQNRSENAAPAVVRRGEGAHSVKGSLQGGHGRIIFSFDRPIRTEVRSTSNILVVTFAEPVDISVERLASELTGYISIIRKDPDGRGLRLAMAKPLKANIMEAGEQVFLDLLPSSWTGTLPTLPQSVVDELARRAREAEARVKEMTRIRQVEPPKPLTYKTGSLPSLTRLVFSVPTDIPVSLKQTDESAILNLNAPYRIDANELKRILPEGVLAVETDTSGEQLKIAFALSAGTSIKGFREDDTYVLDVGRPEKAWLSPETGLAKAEQTPAIKSTQKSMKDVAKEAEKEAITALAFPTADKKEAIQPPTPLSAPSQGESKPIDNPKQKETSKPKYGAGKLESANTASPLQPMLEKFGQSSLKITFPFAKRTAAAAFERDGVVTLVFDTKQEIEPLSVAQASEGVLSAFETGYQKGSARVQVTMAQPKLMRFSPQGDAWVVTFGDDALSASEPLNVTRSVDIDGRTVINVPLTEVSGVHWLSDDNTGDRLAVATAYAPSRGVTKRQSFVEFKVLPSAHGVVIAADAEDIAVRTHGDGVHILRDRGLSLSLARIDEKIGGEKEAEHTPVITREVWNAFQSGNIRERARELSDIASDAARKMKNVARFDLAKMYVANQLAAEANGVFSVMASEEPSILKDRNVIIWSAISDILMNRDPQALKKLSGEELADDPEAVLWRGVIDARARRWPTALMSFKRVTKILESYPEALQAYIRPYIARSGLEMREFADVQRELDKLERLPVGISPKDEMELLRARLADASGSIDKAKVLYKNVIQNDVRPFVAEAMLYSAEMGLREKTLSPEEVLSNLEMASVIWRGDELEIRTLGHMGRLFADAKRWRDAFQVSRRASQTFPNHGITRELSDEMSVRFEDIFLHGRDGELDRLEALALYYDFKEFTPIGRRGDEMIRRLADRMLELDLLDQSADLLQHQVDNRLSGAAKATIAARLASIRLMSGKPTQAVQALESTRLPELPKEVARARLLLEARAYSDLARTDLAIEMLEGEKGPEVDRLKADVYWTGRRWRESGEAFEKILDQRWVGAEPLSEIERRDALRAAISYSLADELLALDRLRSKFAAKMADSEDANAFAFLTTPNAVRTRQFKDIARSIASADTLSEFFTEYRKRYPDSAVKPRTKRPAVEENTGTLPEKASSVKEPAKAAPAKEAPPKAAPPKAVPAKAS
jgi:hypothetical protein